MNRLHRCQTCHARMIRWGSYLTKTGKKVRWRCQACAATTNSRVDSKAREIAMLIDFVTGKLTLAEFAGGGRTLQRRLARAWEYWPVAPAVDEVHHVVHVDGLYLAHRCVLLIAMSSRHVLAWHLARSERASSWADLLAKIAPPDVVITDGGSGFVKACRTQWPNTRIQRCLFHIQANVRSRTTSRPRHQAGVELYALAKALTHIRTQDEQTAWLDHYTRWCQKWKMTLAEKTRLADGRIVNTHERLVAARNLINRRVKAGDMFTYLDPHLHMDGEPIPATNNRIEGLNSQLRAMLRTHRGWPLLRQIKACMWWRYQHTSNPRPASELTTLMPTDTQIHELYQQTAQHQAETDQARQQHWGQAITWADLTWSTNTLKAINE
ncbi:IS1249 family transposase [Schaalia sp. lx-100]|uniref:IS1249 family transposase n=1 Tax=Schaalia sp. lx-100 TaxID=2899081 RepID=UPI002F2B4A19